VKPFPRVCFVKNTPPPTNGKKQSKRQRVKKGPNKAKNEHRKPPGANGSERLLVKMDMK